MKVQGGIVWMAMALQVSTRLWLDGVLSTCRDTELITALLQKVRACALCRPLLFCMDGCQAYIQAIRAVFRAAIWTGKAGRPSCDRGMASSWRKWSNSMQAKGNEAVLGAKDMKAEYDFSRSERGKFHHPNATFSFPVYLEPDVDDFMTHLSTIF